MEHWSNINSAYGRLSSASGITPNASGLSPFDLHVMDQRNFCNSSLTSGLTNPLPAHATSLAPAARLTSMSHPVNYGSLHGSMTPLFDAFGTSGFSNQASYRPVGQALYSLEAANSHADTISRFASVISSQPSRSPSLFNAELHAVNDSSIQGLGSSAESSDFWSRSGFVSPAGGGASFGMPSSSSSGGTKKNPPPAHSGSRPSPATPTKTRFCHELPSVTQQSMKNEYVQRASGAHLSRSLAPSPPTAHANSQRFEAQKFFTGRSSQSHATANDQQYIDSALQMDLDDVISSDDTSGPLSGHGSFGGCSPSTFSSTGFPMVQKTRTQAVFQPAVELSSTPSCLGESRLRGTTYGIMTSSSNPMPVSYAEFGMRKDYGGGTPIRTACSNDSACGRSGIDRDDSFLLSGLLGSSAAQSTISNLPTVQAIADSTTKPKKSPARGSRAAKAGRGSRTGGQNFDSDYPDDSLMGEGLTMSDGRRGRALRSRKASENRSLEQSGTLLENVDRYVPQLVGSPSGVNNPTMFSQPIIPESHLSVGLLQPESYAYSSAGPGKQVSDTQHFLTNIYGNSFVNTNDLLMKAEMTENYTAISETSSYTDDINFDAAEKQNEAAVVDEEFSHLTEAPVCDDSDRIPVVAKCVKSDTVSPTAKASFLASFVNFLGGKKTETLSNLSNVTATSRPVLPKYVPDPRPRKKEETVSRSTVADASEKSKVGLQNSTEEVSNLKKSDKVGSGGLKDAASVIVNSAGPVSKSKDCNKRTLYKSNDDIPEIKVNLGLTGKSNPTPARPQPTRRAKTAVQEKRRSFLDSDDSSDEELKKVSQSRKRRKDEDDDYDSDKDPAWKPEQETFPSSRKRSIYNRDEESATQMKKDKVRRCSVKTEDSNDDAANWSPPPIVSTKATVLSETTSVAESDASLPTSVQLMPNTQQSYQKGGFVIEKKDLKNLSSSFCIWKIDSGRLLQKFEPVTKNGKLLHQAISTYSSWSDDIKQNYSAIKVNILVASRSHEVVEVVEGIGADVKQSVVSYALLVEPFNIFIQILLSQSLEPNFLDALLQDPDPYYMDPLKKIEVAIESGLDQLKKASKWTKEFLKFADTMPTFVMIPKMTELGYCKATENSAVSAVTCIRFSGTSYDSVTLKTLDEVESCKEFAVGEWTRQYLPTYHGLQHLKFTFYQKCKAKVNELKQDSEMEDHQMLDLCLQNLPWMKELFTTLESLLKEANNVQLT